MTQTELLLAALALLLLLVLVMQVVALLRGRAGGDRADAGLAERIERVEREVRMQLQTTAQTTHAATVQQFEDMRRQLQAQGLVGREEQSRGLKQFADSMNQALARLTESNAARMQEVRATLEAKIKDLQADNGARLEEMRKTVDEKLHATLETRLTASFQQVSERLERVHQGLGEMQQLALGVGDLKRVLTNVKTRGTWGEVQLEMLLEQVLTPEQYAKNVETIAGSLSANSTRAPLPAMVSTFLAYCSGVSTCSSSISSCTSPQVPRVLTLVSTRFKSPTPSASCCISPSPWWTRSSRSDTCWNEAVRRVSKVACSFSSTVLRISSSRARTGTGGARRGQNDLGKIRVASAHHRLRHPVPADRGAVRGSDAPSGAGR